MIGSWSELWRDFNCLLRVRRQAKRVQIGCQGLRRSRVESLEPRLVLTISAEEQLFVYLLNKARHDPQQYEIDQKLPVSLAGVAAQPPLAANTDLFDSAQFHASEMAVHNYFGHQSDVTGDWPNKMARDQGYVLPSYFESDNNYIESLAAGTLSDTAQEVIDQLVIDKGVPSLGHRKHLLSIGDFYEQSREIGVGHASNISSKYTHYWAIHATFSNESDTFLTGVVYQDANKDQAFSLKEGLAGVTVSISGRNLQTTTNPAGGWSIKVPSTGTYTVNVSGGSFIGTASASVTVAGKNREVDFISGNTSAAIDFAPISGGNPSTPNQAPVNKLPFGPINVTRDQITTISGISLSDPDAANNSVAVTFNVNSGVLMVSTTVQNGVNSQQVVGNGGSQIVITAPIAKINATLADSMGLIYQSSANFTGSDTLTMKSDDQSHNGAGTAQQDIDSVGINVVDKPVSTAPILTIPAGFVTSTKGAKVNVGAGATLTDVDSTDFAGGKVTILIATGLQSGDVLTLTSVGTKAGQINLSGTKVRSGKTVIGKLSGGSRGVPLQIEFTASVTPATVQSVLQTVTLKSSKKKLLAGPRSIQFVVTDPGLLASTPMSRSVDVQA